jgi:hypothetical protein
VLCPIFFFHCLQRLSHASGNMSSDDQSGIDQSPSSSPPPPPPPPPPSSSSVLDKDKHIERIISNRGLRTFLVVDHAANLRKGTKVSAIWHHGGEAFRHRGLMCRPIPSRTISRCRLSRRLPNSRFRNGMSNLRQMHGKVRLIWTRIRRPGL